MAGGKRNWRTWILALFIAALCFGVLGSIVLLIPREPPMLEPGVPDSFRFMPDPHLFLSFGEVSQSPTIGGSSVRATLIASNTAAGEMTIDLRNLRLALVTAEGTLDPVMPVWEGEVSALEPNRSSTARVTFPVPQGVEPEAILIWENYSFLRLIPGARGSILCPTLKLSLDEPGIAEPLH